MNPTSEWYQGLMLQPPVILGRQLKPFSLIHYSVLSGMRNPYVVGGRCHPQNLVVACLICGMQWSEIRERIYGRFALTVREKLWTRAAAWRDFVSHSEAFKLYVADSVATPDRWSEAGKSSGGISAPWEFHIVRTLCKEWRMDHEHAWNLPFNLAACYSDVSAEAHGDKSLVSEDQKQKIAEAKNG